MAEERTPIKSEAGKSKVGKVMGEYKRGTLHHGGTGKIVKNKKVAVAIALSEARRVAKKKGSLGR